MPAECAICLSKLQCEERLDCQHLFCRECINRWLSVNNVCPICIQQVGPTPHNTLSKHPQPSIPCSDHLYPQQATLRQRLNHLTKLIDTKRQYGQKACFSKSSIQTLTQKLYEAEEMFDLFSSLVEHGAPFSEAVGAMEAVHMMAIELEGVLEGGRAVVVKGGLFEEKEGGAGEWEGEYTGMDYQDEEMFPEITVKVDNRKNRNKGRKGKSSVH